MAQTALNQGAAPQNIFQLMGAGSAQTQITGRKSVSSGNGLSFKALLQMDPAQLSSAQSIKDFAITSGNNDAKGLGLFGSLPALLQAQTDEGIQLSLPERLAQNIKSMLGQATDGENIDQDLMFSFNAPGAVYGNGKNAFGVDAATLEAIQKTGLSNDTIFALIMQQQQNGDVNTLEGTFSLSDNAALQDIAAQIKSAQQEFSALLSGLGDDQSAINALLMPFASNMQAGAQNNLGTNKLGMMLQMMGENGNATDKISGLFVMGRGEGQQGLKPFLKGHSALTPAQLGTTGMGLQTAASTQNNPMNGLSFANLFENPESLTQDELSKLPEMEQAAIKADTQSIAGKSNNMMAARQAGSPHPATQNLMQQINMMASRTPRGDTEMRMQLDPPELGNVLVNLKFGKDNTVKAHLSVERPETLTMLQKDVASLQKALEDAGLDVSQDSLSFDLQQHDDGNASGNGQGFGNNGGGNDGSSANGGDGGNDGLLETEMTIFVDPETGQQRINMMV